MKPDANKETLTTGHLVSALTRLCLEQLLLVGFLDILERGPCSRPQEQDSKNVFKSLEINSASADELFRNQISSITKLIRMKEK
mmetsp:Transcript_26260/g.55209  ORF Transcript_26260/g.55209 Transcript_26260/m.55209 type:complete len:84 (+) Transcript_26260:288-539(+)